MSQRSLLPHSAVCSWLLFPDVEGPMKHHFLQVFFVCLFVFAGGCEQSAKIRRTLEIFLGMINHALLQLHY